MGEPIRQVMIRGQLYGVGSGSDDMIATVEPGSRSQNDYSVGEHLIWQGSYYTVIATIHENDLLTVDTNIQKDTVSNEIETINASLTDNGHSFDFGYDTTSSKYGYYDSEHNFRSFGGGALDTLCKVKASVMYYQYSNGANGCSQVAIFNEDSTYAVDLGSNWGGTIPVIQGMPAIASYINDNSTNFTCDNDGLLRAVKDGYYLVYYYCSSAAPMLRNNIQLLNAGDGLNTYATSNHGVPQGAIYLGVELPE